MIIWYYLDQCTFLGLKIGFWIMAIPFILLYICSNRYTNKRKANSLNNLEDFEIEQQFPLYRIEFRVNSVEQWQIGQIIKRSGYDNIDDLVRDIIENI